MKELNHIELQNVIGGGASAGETYLNGIYGAVEGMTLCASSGVPLVPYLYAGCAIGGAAVNIIWPH